MCTLRLTTRERDLVLEYGYPFPDEATLLRESPARNGEHVVSVGPYWVEMWIADLSRSSRKIRRASLLDEIEALCCVLENAIAPRPHAG